MNSQTKKKSQWCHIFKNGESIDLLYQHRFFLSCKIKYIDGRETMTVHTNLVASHAAIVFLAMVEQQSPGHTD